MQFTIAITTPRYNQYQASFLPSVLLEKKRSGNEAKMCGVYRGCLRPRGCAPGLRGTSDVVGMAALPTFKREVVSDRRTPNTPVSPLQYTRRSSLVIDTGGRSAHTHNIRGWSCGNNNRIIIECFEDYNNFKPHPQN